MCLRLTCGLALGACLPGGDSQDAGPSFRVALRLELSGEGAESPALAVEPGPGVRVRQEPSGTWRLEAGGKEGRAAAGLYLPEEPDPAACSEPGGQAPSSVFLDLVIPRGAFPAPVQRLVLEDPITGAEREASLDTALRAGAAPAGEGSQYFLVQDLPPDTVWCLRVFLPGREILSPRGVHTAGGGTVRLDADFASADLEGRVVDGEGRGVPGARVRLVPPASLFHAGNLSGPRLLAGQSLVQTPYDTLTSGEDGRFHLKEVPAGHWILAVTREDADRPAGERMAPVLVPVTVEPGGAQVEVVTALGLYLAGRVRSTLGLPLDGGMVLARPRLASGKPAAWGPFAALEDGGRFVLGPLLPGTYELSVPRARFGQRRHGSVETVIAEAGAEDLAILVPPRIRIEGRIPECAGGFLNLQAGDPERFGIEAVGLDEEGRWEAWVPEGSPFACVAEGRDPALRFVARAESAGKALAFERLRGRRACVLVESPLALTVLELRSRDGVVLQTLGLWSGRAAEVFLPSGPVELRVLGMEQTLLSAELLSKHP